MYPKLIENTFVKVKPNNSFLSIFRNNQRINLIINKSAEEILSMCNGFYSIEDIVELLSFKYKDNPDKVNGYVNEIINTFAKYKVINDEKSTSNNEIKRGNPKCYLPDSIIWEITDMCPLRCKHCYLGNKKNQLMTDEDIDKVLNMIYISGVTTVQLTGGEPLTHPKLGSIVNELVKNKITTTIATSGTVFNEEILSNIAKIRQVSGVVQISIDGCKEYHNNIRGQSYAYDKSMSFIKKLIEKGVVCNVATCLIDQSEDEIEELSGILAKIGVSMQTIALVVSQGNAKKNNIGQTYTHTRVKRLIEKLNSKYKSEKFNIREYGDSNEKNCGAGYNLLRIKPSLDITPCPMIDIGIGNLGLSDITEISKTFCKLFYNLHSPNNELCGLCNKKDICGRCTANGLNERNHCCWYENQKDILDSIIAGGKACY